MNKYQLVLIFVLFAFISKAQSKYYESNWRYNSIQSSEIKLDAYNYDTKNRVFYFISNDSTQLYVNLLVQDKSVKRKILGFGLSTWVDINGKNKKKFGVKYPVPIPIKQLKNTQHPSYKKNEPHPDANFPEMNQYQEIELMGFDGKKSTQLMSAINTNHINGKIINKPNGNLWYQLTIPFDKIGIIVFEPKLISLIFESGSLEMNSMPAPGGMGAGSGNRPSGIGANGGFAGRSKMNPEQRQQRMQNMEELTVPMKMRIKKLKLSAPE